jgi:hypothetical protein
LNNLKFYASNPIKKSNIHPQNFQETDKINDFSQNNVDSSAYGHAILAG